MAGFEMSADKSGACQWLKSQNVQISRPDGAGHGTNVAKNGNVSVHCRARGVPVEAD
jgi:hypothetical protein